MHQECIFIYLEYNNTAFCEKKVCGKSFASILFAFWAKIFLYDFIDAEKNHI
jgi:hypothetical protein